MGVNNTPQRSHFSQCKRVQKFEEPKNNCVSLNKSTGWPEELSRVGVSSIYSDPRQLFWSPVGAKQKESMIGFLLFRHRFSCCKGLLLKPKRNKNTSVSKTALVHKVEWNPPPFLVGYISLLSDVQVKSDVSSNADAVESLLLLSGMGSPPHSHPQPPDSVRPRASSMSFLQPTASSSLSSLAPNAPSVNLSTSPSSSASTSSSTDQVPSNGSPKIWTI